MTQRNRPKQRVGRAERAQAIGNDYATVERSWSEYISLVEAAIFEYAFKLGAQMTMEMLNKNLILGESGSHSCL